MGVITHPEKIMGITRYILSFLFTAIPGVAVAADGASRVDVQQSARDTGISAIWVLANISYAGMRAQTEQPKRRLARRVVHLRVPRHSAYLLMGVQDC